jgi:HSP20 family molecular chaperone IbpA
VEDEMKKFFAVLWISLGFIFPAEASGLVYSVSGPLDTPKGYVVTVDMSGMDEKDVKVDAGPGRMLTIRAEKNVTEKTSAGGSSNSYGSFSQTLDLPADADPSRLKRDYKDGRLTLTVPRKNAD